MKYALPSFFVFFLMFCICSMVRAQQTNLDSLYSIWENETQPDSSRVKAYAEYIFYGYSSADPDTTILLSKQLYDFSVRRNSESGMRKAAYNLGISFYRKGQYAKALKHMRESERLTGKPHGGTLTLIGAIYGQVSDTAKVLEYFNKGLDFERSEKNQMGIAAGLINIGLIYIELGKLDTALSLTSEGLKLSKEIDAMLFYANATTNLARIYEAKKDHYSSLQLYERAIAIYDSIGYRSGLAFNQIRIGSIHAEQGNHKAAANKCLIGYNLALESGAVQMQWMSCECLYNAYKALGKRSKALEFHELMMTFKDSLNINEADKKLQQMEFEKEMLADSLIQEEEKRIVEIAHEEEVRKKNKTKNVAIGAGLLFLLLAGGFYSRWKYVRRSKAVLQVEKDRSENLLLNILPAEIAEELKEKGEAKARDFEMVSILFTDFKGFTEASAKLSAAKLVEEINTCFKAFDAIAGKYNVEKIKTIGDSYMAAGGLPVPDDSATKKTVLAALEMQAFIIDRKANRDKEGLPAFSMRVGIHTGSVVAGIVGVKKFQYDIWGDTVNTASRMESSGEVGKVNVSRSTYDLIKDDAQFTFESRGKIEAKGKGEMEMYFVSKI
ncbi:MAG: tetratricopeptide repeat protein [Flavobacteriales bacterium]|nr:tetratricopeptide repeat protein [Flavobacteriales bacterium]